MENKSYTVTKKSIELYSFRHPSGMFWADITIDAGEKTGRISIASDFGNYSNYWGSAGCNFKQFLGQISMDYAADKFDADRWFHHQATIDLYRLYAKEVEDKTTRDLIFREIKNLENYNQKEPFLVELMNSNNLVRLFDGCPEIEYTIKPQFKRLWNEVWPEMIKAFKAEQATLEVFNQPPATM
jgi:hypothetical protein